MVSKRAVRMIPTRRSGWILVCASAASISVGAYPARRSVVRNCSGGYPCLSWLRTYSWSAFTIFFHEYHVKVLFINIGISKREVGLVVAQNYKSNEKNGVISWRSNKSVKWRERCGFRTC